MSKLWMQSRDGMPLGNAKNPRSQSARATAHRRIAVGPSHPHTTPHTAMITMSRNWCLRLRFPWVGQGLEIRTDRFRLVSRFRKLFTRFAV